MPRALSPRDGCIVTAEPFADLVRDWSRAWNRDRPQPGGQFGLAQEPPIPALSWLAAEASRVAARGAVDELEQLASRPAIRRGTLEAILRGEEPTIELRIADAIAVALNRLDVWDDARVVVATNPKASRRAQETCLGPILRDSRPCCGGSREAAAAA